MESDWKTYTLSPILKQEGQIHIVLYENLLDLELWDNFLWTCTKALSSHSFL